MFSFWFAGANVDVHYLLPEVVVVLVARELEYGVLLLFLLLLKFEKLVFNFVGAVDFSVLVLKLNELSGHSLSTLRNGP